MILREVTEFIIVPPYEKSAEVARLKERLKDHLSRKFPGYGFKIADFSPVGDDEDFNVLPLMNFFDPEGKSRMCDQPPAWLLGEICEACSGFLSDDLKTVSH